MPKVDADVAERLSAEYPDVVEYLTVRSGLPGPRGNLELLAAVGEFVPAEHAVRLRREPDEYLRCCGVIALWRSFATDRAAATAELTRAASDESWRVREAVAMAAQRVGDEDFPGLADLVAVWLDDPNPLVQRAAVAAVCEPRLLRTPTAAAGAVAACSRATHNLLALPPDARRRPDARTLRQALGYCWSVAVAADPSAGLSVFLALPGDDPDLAWIVRTNRGKARLAKLLPATDA